MTKCLRHRSYPNFSSSFTSLSSQRRDVYLCILSLTIAAAFLPGRWLSECSASPLPPPDFHHLHNYIRGLERSHSPAARAILREIDRGPVNLARERAAARREGIPLDLKQMETPAPPPDQDAGPLYAQLRRLLHDKPLIPPRYAQPLYSRYAYTPDQLAVVRNILESRPDVMQLLHRAADRPYCEFPIENPAIRTSYILSQLATMREAERLLKTESYLLAASGRFSEAISNETRGFRVAQHAGMEENLTGYTAAIAFDAIALNSMRDILQLGGLNKNVARQVQAAIRLHSPHLSLRNSLAGELPTDLYFFDSTLKAGLHSVTQLLGAEADWQNNTDKKGYPPQRLSASDARFLYNLLDAQQADVIRRMRLAIEGVHDRADLSTNIVFARASREELGNPVAMMTSLMLLPINDDLAYVSRWLYAEEGVTLVAASVLDRRTQTGSFPLKAPISYKDPFSGKELGYGREGHDGFGVYSVGPDAAYVKGRPFYARLGLPPFFRYPPLQSPVPPEPLHRLGRPVVQPPMTPVSKN